MSRLSCTLRHLHHSRAQRALAVWLVAVGLLTAACSPEATRTRSGGPGADVGNRGPTVDLHGSSNPYFLTPKSGQAIEK
jgi:hypothetical protein